MKRTHDTTNVATLLVRVGLITALAATILAPTSIKVSGAEAMPHVDPGKQRPGAIASDRILQPASPAFTSQSADRNSGFDNPAIPVPDPTGRLELPVNAYRG